MSDQLLLANSHAHANGMGTDTHIEEFAHEDGVKLGTGKFNYIRSDGYRVWSEGHHSESHEAYDQSVRLINTPQRVYRVVKDGLVHDGRNGCIYTRLLTSASNNCRVDAETIPVFERNMLAIVGAIEDARAETGIETFVSISVKRHLPFYKADLLLDAFEAFRGKHSDKARYITGIDMAGDEEKADCKNFNSVFERAKRLGLKGSCHAGEVKTSDDIREALNLPGVRQISHGLSAINDPVVMEELKERNILLDQLLISNAMLHTKLYGKPENHPIAAYVRNGLHVALGSDDPGIQGTTIRDEYRKAANEFGFTSAQCLQFTINAVRFGFMPIEVKERLLGKVQVYAARHGIALRPDAVSGPGMRQRPAQPDA